LLVVTIAVVFVNLGLWQLRRNDERRMVNTVGQSRIGEEPLPLETLLDAAGDDISSLEYRPAMATGVFDPGNEVLIRSQVSLGTAGFHVITPLIVGEGEAVLVNRGWIPLVLDEIPVGDAPPPAGEVTVEGWVDLTQTRGALGPSDPEEGRLVTMSRVDIDRIAAQAPYDLAPVYLVETGRDGNQLPLPAPVPSFDDNGPHLAYAIQWFGFAVVGLVGYGFLARRVLRGSSSAVARVP
jgi:surfeit locus 1 family protein